MLIYYFQIYGLLEKFQNFSTVFLWSTKNVHNCLFQTLCNGVWTEFFEDCIRIIKGWFKKTGRNDQGNKFHWCNSRQCFQPALPVHHGKNPADRFVSISVFWPSIFNLILQLLYYSYEKMYNMNISSKVMKHQELLQCIEGIIKCHLVSCSHLALTAIKTSLM